MFKRSKSYQRRYNSIVGIDKISDDIVESKGIDSYKPSKSNSVTDTLVCDLGEDEVFNNKSSCDYANDMDLLGFTNTTENDIAIDGVDETTPSSEEKNKNLILIVGLILGVVITIVVNILM